MTDPADKQRTEDIARQRWMVLNIVRIGGLALVLVALAIHYGRIPWPEPVAWVLAATGLLEFFIAPKLLARRWRDTGQ